ncbi:MAG: glycoside hydrolase family 6 protein [Polyangiaceae bacterium]|nr:glycoside hydrolase family 6 protein [Polyangiaceae bacterium]
MTGALLMKSFFLASAVMALGLTSGCIPKGGREKGESSQGRGTQSTGKVRFRDEQPILDPPDPPPVTENPLVGKKLFVDPQSLAMLRANAIRASYPQQATVLDRIAQQPQALWMGDWNTDVFRAVEFFVERAKKDGSVPVMIAYNIPYRDCDQYSKGGVSSGEAYRRWIRNLAAGIGQDEAVVILEPDALGHFGECLTKKQEEERMFLLRDAVQVLRKNPHVAVYLDAGHPRWQSVEEITRRLSMAGIENAHGFALNVSNYIGTEECREYGHAVSELLAGKHFIVDTSRNGAGPYEQAQTAEESWCNPPGRKIGFPPTTQTGDPICDALLWLKRPGESDGECNGGPKAGQFWMEQALQMAQ